MVWLLAQYNAPATNKSITTQSMPPTTTITIAGSPPHHDATSPTQTGHPLRYTLS